MRLVLQITAAILLSVALLWCAVAWKQYSDQQSILAACLRHDIIGQDWCYSFQSDVEHGLLRPDGSSANHR